VLTDAVIEQAGRTLAEEAGARRRACSFSDRTREETRQPTATLTSSWLSRAGQPSAEEWVRLRDALPPLGVPVDVIVMSDDLVRRRRDVPGSRVYTALREGRLVAES
jgi:hypothetical protein